MQMKILTITILSLLSSLSLAVTAREITKPSVDSKVPVNKHHHVLGAGDSSEHMALDEYVIPLTTLQYDPKGIGPELEIKAIQPITYPYPSSPSEHETIPESLFYIDLPRIETSVPVRYKVTDVITTDYSVGGLNFDDLEFKEEDKFQMSQYFYGYERPKYTLHLPEGAEYLVYNLTENYSVGKKHPTTDYLLKVDMFKLDQFKLLPQFSKQSVLLQYNDENINVVTRDGVSYSFEVGKSSYYSVLDGSKSWMTSTFKIIQSPQLIRIKKMTKQGKSFVFDYGDNGKIVIYKDSLLGQKIFEGYRVGDERSYSYVVKTQGDAFPKEYKMNFHLYEHQIADEEYRTYLLKEYKISPLNSSNEYNTVKLDFSPYITNDQVNNKRIYVVEDRAPRVYPWVNVVEDRAPRVYPWVNERDGGILYA
ncbi:hypothetical protein [Cysteiniphilum litorale]|uniref:hypothetical protein n=1 Tax=Cysteiniphilum litorale TaxID=2056700 RepID=UPI003F882484